MPQRQTARNSNKFKIKDPKGEHCA